MAHHVLMLSNPKLTKKKTEHTPKRIILREPLHHLSGQRLVSTRSFTISGQLWPLLANNNLEGEIPESYSGFNSLTFENNVGLCGPPLPTVCGDVPSATDTPPGQGGKSSKSKIAIIGIVTLIILLFFALVSIISTKKKKEDEFSMLSKEPLREEVVEVHVPESTRRSSKPASSEPTSSRKGGDSKRGSQHGSKGGMTDLIMINDEKEPFGLQDLMKAAAEVLGNGGLGSAYKAVMANGLGVVVKRMREMNKLGKDGFDAEMKRDYAFQPLTNPANVAQGLFAYKSPEYIQYQQVSPKSDVYCLGIIILEIITGKFPSQYLSNGKGGTDIVQWVQSSISENQVEELIDPEILNDTGSINQMVQLLQIGAECTESNPDQRLQMKEAIRRIEEVQ
ncbi:hypothetical protein CCACVL1_20754 [Corchorus capsularis]|uniref:Protein kinase domain-containing protein n=1 Tax=Corchorus capsularis TaxID=210143 RepID=A0A1R3HA53_COCAP|nr:hypothetical protein CCACVL1_20754 [Corchorus capsularis]